MLRNHRGLSLMRRVKAVFWWCYLHTESPKPARDVLASMPTDDDIDFLYRTYSVLPKREDGGPEWGDRVVWEELHHGTRTPSGWTRTCVLSRHTFCPISRLCTIVTHEMTTSAIASCGRLTSCYSSFYQAFSTYL